MSKTKFVQPRSNIGAGDNLINNLLKKALSTQSKHIQWQIVGRNDKDA